MTHNILILGNGFDIDHFSNSDLKGKTSFRNLKNHLKKNEKNIYNKITKISNSIFDKLLKFSTFIFFSNIKSTFLI